MTASIFGTFTSRGEVRQAVLGTLQTWIVTYLAEVERQEGLAPRTITPPGGGPPPGGVSYPDTSIAFRSGLDFQVWQTDQLPLLIVVAQPFGDAERYEAGKYVQPYEVQVAAVCEDSDGNETVAQQQADRYGKAVMGLLAQQGGLGSRLDDAGTAVPFSEKTVLVSAPHTEFVDGADRKYAQSVATVHAWVDYVVDEHQGPRVPPADPYVSPAQWPAVTQVDLGLQSQTPAGATSPATGGTVTKRVGAGQIVVNE